MKRFYILFLIIFTAAFTMCLPGCASGTSYEDYKKSIPELDNSLSRLVIYRNETIATAIQPTVMLDGQKLCKAVPLGFTYIDVKPGKHIITCTTEAQKTYIFTSEAGKTEYIKLQVYIGVFVGHIAPQFSHPLFAIEDLKSCKYIGNFENTVVK